MVHPDEVGRQLKRLHANFQFWCRPEIRELPKIMFEGELLQHVLIGRYEGGFALFTATDRRVLLIDKKPFYLTLEDIRYDMVSDVQYNHRLIDATVRLGTVHKTIAFTGYNHTKLRDFTNYIQQQVMYYRQQQSAPAQQPVVKPSFPAPQQPAFQQSLPAAAAQQSAQEPATPALIMPQQPVMNPYKMPVVIRRRISRFY